MTWPVRPKGRYAASMRIALYQPDIPQNTGALIRIAACFGLGLDLIGPYGFTLSDRALKRAGMDYLERAAITEHESWETFTAAYGQGKRLVLLTTTGDTPYTQFAFKPDDILLLGRESAGVPEAIHRRADAGLLIPMQPGTRSLNVAIAGAIVASEALRQTNAFPVTPPRGQ